MPYIPPSQAQALIQQTYCCQRLRVYGDQLLPEDLLAQRTDAVCTALKHQAVQPWSATAYIMHHMTAPERCCAIRRAKRRRFEFRVGRCIDSPPRPSERRVQGIWPVGGSYQHHTAPAVQSIHERQQGRHDAVVNLILLAGPHLQHNGITNRG